MRLHQLLCPDLAHLNKFTDNVRSYVDKDTYQEALKHLAEDSCYRQSELLDDVDPVLKQLPVPIYVLDTLHTLLSTMIRNVILEEPFKKEDFIEMMELSMSVLIVENLINLLLDCVSDEFWKFEHSSKTQRDIAHKSCMAMRLLADLLNKYKRSFTKDNSRWRHRVAWLRLVFCAQRLISWAHQSLLPSTLVLALQVAQIDPALDILYPKVAQNIVDVLQDIGEILFTVLKKWSMDDTDWSVARAITLRLMAHNCSWVQIIFYKTMCESVNEIFCDNNEQELEKEKDLYLLCDVGILTELCCQGLSSPIKQVADSANDIMLYLLRGRLLLSESCWWRLLASVLPILPLLHCYAAHETSLGQAICKSLEVDIADCMGIPRSEVIWGLVRLLYVKCPMVQMDAALHLCQLLDDEKYLPQKELLRSDVLVNALRGVKTHNFNVDTESSSPKLPQVNSIIQIMDVLKQDIIIDENAVGFMEHFHRSHPVLQPSVRLSTLQQLSVLMRDPYSHETFIKHDGLQITISILRMALSVDDFLAFPDCALSCISILNSVCYNDRHSLAKIADLPLLLLRAILIFPSKDSLVEMASQVLSVTAWAGFALQELDRQRKRVVALPKCVSENTTLPFPVQSYWSSSPNAVHSCLEWLLSEECWRSALRVRWACAWNGAAQILRDISSSPISSPPPGPLSLRVTPDDLTALQSACPLRATARALMILQNATSHTQVTETIAILEGYMYLIKMSSIPLEEFAALPWTKTMARFLIAAPASPRDVTLLISILKFILHYAHNVSEEKMLMKWIITSFIESDDGIITLLSRRQLFPQQTEQEDIEIIQLHKHIVKVLLRCVIILDRDDNFEVAKIESLFKILLCCLEKINLKDFHMLGYLNEVVRCLRYIANSRHCRPGESLIIQSLSQLNKVVAKCGVGDAGYKGQACRLDAMLTMLALVRRAHDENIPVQHWSECWSEATVRAVCACCCAGRPELRAAALHLLATLAHYTQLLPHLQQAVPGNSLCKYAVRIFSETSEANVVRAAAAALLSALCTRSSTYTNSYLGDACTAHTARASASSRDSTLLRSRPPTCKQRLLWRVNIVDFSYVKTVQQFYQKYLNDKYVGLFQARRPTLLLIDLDLVKNVLVKEFSRFSDRISVATDTRREPLLRNLANMSGNEWKMMRHIITPTFSTAKMKAMFPLVADCASLLQETLRNETSEGSDIDVPKLMCRYTTDVIGSCAFGVNPGSLENPESPFLKMSQKMFKTDHATLLKRYCRTFFPRLFKALNLRSYSSDVEAFFTSIIKQVLEERRTTGCERNDFLQLMLKVQMSENETGFKMTDELMTSNSFIFMLAGLETSATTLSFCFYELAKNKDLQDDIRKEVSECLHSNGGLTYEAVCSMRLVVQTVSETLRLHPPTPFTTRLCTSPCVLPGTDLQMKARDSVLIPIFSIQRDSRYFLDPDKFDPRRFQDDASPPAFMAFGEGPRSCPGARFAQLMVCAALASVLSAFMVEPCARTSPRLHYDPRSVMLKNVAGVWLRFTPMQP
ncbi:Cytochrome P450 6a2 [Eumeta japonica]|uniref:unspecific monooxygenase n=1 Tax=Eumeta variegata TaxID=151549 RepID=A0A4C1X3Z8_EUMVA|nr:Cytochrome P450 6a2 [Eumeta japonica]